MKLQVLIPELGDHVQTPEVGNNPTPCMQVIADQMLEHMRICNNLMLVVLIIV